MTLSPSPIFVDTAAWIALVNKSDVLHPQATSLHQEILSTGATYVTTDYVLTEVANALARPPYRIRAIRFLEVILSSQRVTVIPITRERFRSAWQLYRSRRDKEWGLTDCASFIVMKELHLREAFTSDRHYQQAGFVCLLRPRE